MNRGEWYKSFGSSDNSVNPTEAYYHIVDIENDSRVLVDEYTYYVLLKKLVKTTKTPVVHTSKGWLEQIIHNDVYLIDKEQVPFLLHF